MLVDVVLGAQWGDEGKGKIVSFLTRIHKPQLVARFQGGPNAGHTVMVDGEAHVFRMLPSGFFHSRECMLGSGMVINITQLVAELEFVEERGYSTDSVWISLRAHVILPTHQGQEKSKLNTKIGTTQTGVGPAYTDKIHRSGLRVADIVYNSDLFLQQDPAFQTSVAPFIKKYKTQCVDTVALVQKKLADNKRILAEGAQGALLDIDHGHYPYVTSSNTTIGAVCTGLGVSPKQIDNVYLVACAYMTKVGGGPFPTQLDNSSSVARLLQDKGREIDPVTNQLRNCGWLDLVFLRQAVEINQPTGLILTKLDVLSGIPELKVATAYLLRGKKVSSAPVLAEDLSEVQPVFKECKPWSMPLDGMKHKSELPSELLAYIKIVEQFIRCKIIGISMGTDELDYIEL